MLRRRLGPAGVTLWASKRKRTPSLLHEGKDGVLRFWNTARSFAGNWRAGRKREMTILPESKSVFQITKGPPMGMASANGVATLSPKFLYYADRFSEYFGKHLEGQMQMGPAQIAEYLNSLRFRETEIRGILTTLTRIKNHEISMADAVNVIMAERGYEQSDEESRTKLERSLQGAVDTSGKSYEDELRRITDEKRIRFKEGGWKIEWEAVKEEKPKSMFKKVHKVMAIKHVFTAIPVTLMNYIQYMPGATIDDLQTALLNAEQAAKLERTEDKSQQFKWVTLAIIVFIIFLGMYIVYQQFGK
jgi:hypothetical protein